MIAQQKWISCSGKVKSTYCCIYSEAPLGDSPPSSGSGIPASSVLCLCRLLGPPGAPHWILCIQPAEEQRKRVRGSRLSSQVQSGKHHLYPHPVGQSRSPGQAQLQWGEKCSPRQQVRERRECLLTRNSHWQRVSWDVWGQAWT